MEDFATRNNIQLPVKLESSIRIVYDVSATDVDTNCDPLFGAPAKIQTGVSILRIRWEMSLLAIDFILSLAIEMGM